MTEAIWLSGTEMAILILQAHNLHEEAEKLEQISKKCKCIDCVKEEGQTAMTPEEENI